MPDNITHAVDLVRASHSVLDGFALLADATDARYLEMTNCGLQMVGLEFSQKPYGIALQQGSPLKDKFDDA